MLYFYFRSSTFFVACSIRISTSLAFSWVLPIWKIFFHMSFLVNHMFLMIILLWNFSYKDHFEAIVAPPPRNHGAGFQRGWVFQSSWSATQGTNFQIVKITPERLIYCIIYSFAYSIIVHYCLCRIFIVNITCLIAVATLLKTIDFQYSLIY